ncbi:hypothetical protein GGF31_001931 [Allomyces arbusculus]|nr:hypothetical protein GGF31_001931 [Allomyces arbusculus]
MNGGNVDKVALNKLVVAIGDNTGDQVLRDTLIAHSILLILFFRQLYDQDGENKYLYTLSVHDRLAKAVIKDVSLVKNVPLPPLDVAMFWHSLQCLSPIRYAEDMMRMFGPSFDDIEYQLMRLAGAPVRCPSCMVKQALAMGESAPFCLHGKSLACTSCTAEFTAEFTAENVSMRRFLTLVEPPHCEPPRVSSCYLVMDVENLAHLLRHTSI